MTLYILDREPTEIQRIWDSFVPSGPDWTRHEDLNIDFNLSPILMASQSRSSRTLCSIRFRESSGYLSGRILILLGVLVFEFLLLHYMIAIMRLGNGQSTPVEVLIFASFLSALFIPLLLGIFYWMPNFYDECEDEYLQELIKNGVEAKPLTPRRHWVLFPGDLGVVIGIEVAVGWSQITPFISDWDIISIIGPFGVLLFVLTVGIMIARELAFARLEKALSTHSFWRMRASELEGPASFVIPGIIFYWAMRALMEYNTILYQAIRSGETIERSVVFERLARQSDIAAGLDRGSLSAFFGRSLNVVSERQANDLQVAVVIMLSFLTVGIFLMMPVQLEMERRKWTTEWEKDPQFGVETPPTEVSRATTFEMIAVALTIFRRFVAVALGMSSLVLGMMWVTDAYPVMLPLRWFAPFVWFEAMAGSLVARLATIVIMAPAIIWLGCHIHWFVRSLWFLFVEGVSPKGSDDNHPVSIRTRQLCMEIGMAPPRVRLNRTTEGWPEAALLCPVPPITVLRIPLSLVDELTLDQLDFVLAHELAHLRLHSRRIWLAQIASMVSLSGRGYFTMLLDYRRMEFEADAAAADLVGNSQDVQEMLTRMLPIIEYRAGLRRQREQYGQTRRRQLVRIRNSADGIAKTRMFRSIYLIYKLYFGSSLWGKVHPSGQLRAAALSQNKYGNTNIEKRETDNSTRSTGLPSGESSAFSQ